MPFAKAPSLQIALFQGSQKERTAFDFFLVRIAPQLSGFFFGDMWKRLIVQMGQAEPAIRSTIIAASAMHQREISLRGTGGADKPADVFALESYNQAIRCVAKKAEAGPEAFAVILTGCLMFICIEFIRGNMDSAIVHTQSGMQILQVWRQRHGHFSSPWDTHHVPAEISFVETQLGPMLSWLGLFSARFGRPFQPFYLNSIKGGTKFVPISPVDHLSARSGITDIMNATLGLIMSNAEAKYDGTVTAESYAEKDFLDDALQTWHTGWKEYLRKGQHKFSVEELTGVDTIWYIPL